MLFGANKDRAMKDQLDKIQGEVDTLREEVRLQDTRLDDHAARLSALERVDGALDEISGYRDMTRDELLRIHGVLDVHERTLKSLIEWATTEDDRERLKSLLYRFRHHRTRCGTALAALDG